MQFLMDYMRHHKRLFQFVILIVIGIPFCMWTVPGGASKKAKHTTAQGEDVVGWVGSEPILTADFRRAIDSARQRKDQTGKLPTIEDLQANGTVERIAQQLENGAYLRLQEKARTFDVDNSLAKSEMQKWPQFRTEKDEFVPSAWNEWVKAQPNEAWNTLYSRVKEGISNDVFLTMLTAPAAHVLDKEIDEEMTANFTKLKVKFASVEPDAGVTDEQVAAHFEKNKEKYRYPKRFTVEYAALSMLPEVPAEAVAAVKKAREGAEFDGLTGEFTEPKAQLADLGWVAPEESAAASTKTLLALPVGGVSDPIVTPNGIIIYKVEEERTNDQGKREVKAKQLLIATTLAEDKAKERRASADALLAKAKEANALAAPAQEAGLAVKQAPAFSRKDMAIESIPESDVPVFRTTIDRLPEGTAFTVVAGHENLYVAHVLSAEQGEIPPLAEVRERVKEDVTMEAKQGDAYQEQVKALCDTLSKETGAIEDIAGRHPELAMKIQETEPFTARDFNVLSKVQCYVSPRKIWDTFKGKEAGTTAGPLRDFFGKAYLMQLVERIDPTDADKATWNEERAKLLEQRTQMERNAYLMDYIADLRDRLKGQVEPGYVPEKVAAILGKDKMSVANEGEAQMQDKPVPQPVKPAKPGDDQAGPY